MKARSRVRCKRATRAYTNKTSNEKQNADLQSLLTALDKHISLCSLNTVALELVELRR